MHALQAPAQAWRRRSPMCCIHCSAHANAAYLRAGTWCLRGSSRGSRFFVQSSGSRLGTSNRRRRSPLAAARACPPRLPPIVAAAEPKPCMHGPWRMRAQQRANRSIRCSFGDRPKLDVRIQNCGDVAQARARARAPGAVASAWAAAERKVSRWRRLGACAWAGLASHAQEASAEDAAEARKAVNRESARQACAGTHSGPRWGLTPLCAGASE
jgi:hypothetical protein